MTANLDFIYRRDKGICHLCGKPVERADATKDHVQPRSFGGATVRANLKLAHRKCNNKRGNDWNWEVGADGSITGTGHRA